MVARTQTMVQLNEGLLELLDKRAAAEGVSRSLLIRRALEEYLAGDRASALDQLMVDGYTRMPQSDFDADEWGDLGRMMTAMSADQMRRLNDEEREAGFDPW